MTLVGDRNMSRGRFSRPNLPFVSIPKSVANRKLLTEAELLLNHPVPGCEAAPRNDDVMIWTAVIEGPVGSLYEGGLFFVQLHFDDGYPFVAPGIVFLTRIYHCNIDSEGRVSLSLTRTDWNPCHNVSSIMRALQQLLRQPELTPTFQSELVDQYKNNPEKYCEIAREWTRRYAH